MQVAPVPAAPGQAGPAQAAVVPQLGGARADDQPQTGGGRQINGAGAQVPLRGLEAPRAARSRSVVPERVVPPTNGTLSSSYGRRWGRLHAGLDFAAPVGTEIRAVASGLVVHAGPKGGYGEQVAVRHPQGTFTTYSHMSRVLVRPGLVRVGQVLGLVGSTGRSTGPHLHFEVRPDGLEEPAVDPAPWLRSRGVRLPAPRDGD